MVKNKHVGRPTSAKQAPRKGAGQALVEYALIIALVAIAILGIIAITGPAVGNVFSNAVWNLVNQTVTPYNTLSPGELVGYLTAVASYTPPPRGQGATGTVGPTRTPIPSATPVGTLTPTPTKTQTITPTMTATGPTVTPVDKQFNTNNVYSIGVTTDWHYDTFVSGGAQEPSRARMLWRADYYNGVANWSGATLATDTINDHLKFNWGTSAPRSGVPADNFSVQYTALSFSDGLPGVNFTAGEMWQIRVTGNQFIDVFLDGAVRVTLNDQGANTIGTKVGYYSAGSTGRKTLLVRAYEGSGDAQIEVTINRVADYGNCHWQTTANDYRSEYIAWADSAEAAAQPYRPNGSCTLRQRGWYDLATVANPRLIFWNRWKLNTGDSLQVGVRRHGSATDRWAWAYAQRAIGNNFNWNRQIIDLTKFPAVFDDAAITSTALGTQPTGTPTLTDYSGSRIEIAFRVVTDGGTVDVEDGWYIDDVGVFNWAPEVGDYPYRDNVDSSTRTDWINECKWNIVVDAASSRTVWTTGRYTSGSDCSLTLDRAITIPSAAVDANTPLLEFDAKTKLDSGDQVRVEWADPTTDLMLPASWTALPKIGGSLTCPPTTGFAIYCSTTDMAWETIKVDLTPIRTRTVMIRFRLLADTSGDPPVATLPYSWSIDNVWIHGNNVTEVPMPFIEPFSTSTNWTLNNWSLTSGSDYTRSSPTALTDSPNGAQYTPTTNITTQLNPAVRIVGATDPIVSFYTRWQAPTANLQLDLSADDGFTWTPIWQFNRTTMGDENRAWERFEVRLADVPSVIIGTTSRVMFRFKLLATGSSTVGDGFYIDDFRVEQAPLTMLKTLNAANNFTFTEALDTAPKGETANPTDFEWHAGGEWSWQATAGRDGTGGWTDSQGTGVNYNNPQRSILEYRSRVTVPTGAANYPALVFWTKYNMASGHTFAVDIKGNTGDWTQVWSNVDVAVATPTNLGWHRVVIPISTALAQPVRARFRLSAMDANPSGDGIYLDGVQFVDRAVWTDFNTVVPGFTTVSDQNKWIREGDWKVPVTGVPVNPAYGTLFGKPEVQISTLNTLTAPNYDWGTPIGTTSQWATQYWHTNSASYWSGPGTMLNWTALLATAPNVSQVNPELSLNVSSDPTNLPIPPGVPAWGTAIPKNDWYAIRYRRRFNGNGGTYLLRLNVTGGAEVRVGGTLLSPNTSLVAPYVTSGSASNVANPAARTYYYTATIGTNTEVDVRFWHSTDAISGSAKIEFGIAEARTVAKTSAYAAPYTHLTKTSLILDGYVTIPAGSTGSVSYDERWSLAQTDNARAFYSLDRGATWTLVGSTEHTTSSTLNANGVSNQDWITSSYLIPNISGTPAKVMLKWELDARTNPAVADGWLIDNVIFAISAGATNFAPTASTLTATTVAGTTTSNVAPVVTDANMPLDYFDVAITSTPRRGTAVRNNVTGNTDTVSYAPSGDWTGIDNTMLYSVTDQGGLTLSGQPATFTVNPKFHTGLDVGDVTTGSVGTIDGNGWIGQTGTTISPTINGTQGSLTTVTSSGSTTKDNMLRDFVKAPDATTGLRLHFGVPAGVYSVYLYWVQSETTAQTFDVYLQGGADVVGDSYKGNRVENNLAMGAQGTWVRTGPYTVTVSSSMDLSIRAVDGGIAALAGMELYQGGDYLNYTSIDVNPASSVATPSLETVPGTTSISGGTITVTAYGHDIWDTADGFRYVYKAERGDLDYIARIDSATLTSDGWAKAGIMFRSSVDANSPYMFFGFTAQTGTNSTVVQTRLTAGGGSSSTGEYSRTAGAPLWLKIQKRGNTFDVFVSADGTNYGTSLGTHTVTLGSSYLYGLAVTAHTNGATSSAQFSGITAVLQ